jgi:hypothetical protein
MVNLKFIEDRKTKNGPYEVTQLINSFLGALAHPWEIFKEELKSVSLAEAESQGWPIIIKEYQQDNNPKNLGDLLRLIRNGLAHGNIEFIPDSNNEIRSIRIWNHERGERTWGANITVQEMRRFLDLFVDLAQELHEKEQLRRSEHDR